MGYAYEGMGRVLDTHIRNLRKKIEPDADNPRAIQTVYGVGHRVNGHVGLLVARSTGRLASDQRCANRRRNPAPRGWRGHLCDQYRRHRRCGGESERERTDHAPGRSGAARWCRRVADARAGGSRELVTLAHAFNTMAGDLQRAEEQRANLMADVSHELRTPLTALEGNLRAALDRVYALDEAEIADLYGQTRHLIRLVNDLRELALAEARQLPLHKQPTDLRTLVDETVRVFAPLAEEQGVHLEQQIEDLPTLQVDAARIRQVLHNLLANALRHTPAGGRVTVIGRPDHDAVYLAVLDTGAGLDADQIPLVFDRFYRGDRSRSRDTGGTGLGLAIVKAIIEAHDGRVVATSHGVDQGSSFALYLPQS